ncbi:secretin receptor-like [Mytilus edulis]
MMTGNTNFTAPRITERMKTLFKQRMRLHIEKQTCEAKIINYTTPQTGSFCDMVWDNIMCWDATPAGTTAKMKCPHYVEGFSNTEFATKTCTENGTWYVSPHTNDTWTDYTRCPPVNLSLMEEHLPRIKLMYNIGYGLSLGSLLVAVFLMCFCRRLYSKSNTLHINLFFAFILRASMSCIRDILFVDGFGLAKDVKRGSNGGITFIQEGSHWECKLIYCLLLYGVTVTCTWIFTEALYLHMLVYKTLFTERHGVKLYMIIGWFTPLLFVIPWIIVRIELEDVYCWNWTGNTDYQWIITGPVLLINGINFIFFVDLVRVLYKRVHTNKRVTGSRKIRKLSKFIVVLIPLFGVLYIVFSFLYNPKLNEERDVVVMYAEMFYNSFQGLLLAIVFCFLNEEIHVEIRKCWYKYALSRTDSTMYTRTAMLSTWRHTGSQSSRGHSNIDNTQSDICLNDNVGGRNYRNGVKKPKSKMVPNVRIRFQSSDVRNSRSSSNSSPTQDRESRYLKLEEAYITRT